MLDVKPFEHVYLKARIGDWIVLWCDYDLNRCVFGCREKTGDQLRWCLEYTGAEDSNLDFECVPVTTKKEDKILRTMILRDLELREKDLQTNEVLYVISIPYIRGLDERMRFQRRDVAFTEIMLMFSYVRKRRRGCRRRRDTDKEEYNISLTGSYM